MSKQRWAQSKKLLTRRLKIIHSESDENCSNNGYLMRSNLQFLTLCFWKNENSKDSFKFLSSFKLKKAFKMEMCIIDYTTVMLRSFATRLTLCYSPSPAMVNTCAWRFLSRAHTYFKYGPWCFTDRFLETLLELRKMSQVSNSRSHRNIFATFIGLKKHLAKSELKDGCWSLLF